MKKLLLLLFIVAFSCQQATDNLHPTSASGEENFISIEKAAQIAQTATAPTAQPNARGQAKKIKSQLTIDDADDKEKKTPTQPVFYIFNYEEGGYSIISADDRIESVLAIADKGPGIEAHSDLPGGLILWMQAAKNQIQNIRKAKLIRKTIKGGRSGPVITGQKNPLLATEWNQGCGYNDYIPGSCSNNCGHPWAGCVAVAMGQVIRYWGTAISGFTTNFNYNWSSFPVGKDASGNEIICPQTRQLLLQAGTSVNTSYGCSSSGAYLANIADALKSGITPRPSFGYSSANFVGGYNSQDVINNLNQNWPVILGGCTQGCTFLTWQYGCGECHAWVCDGYIRTEMPGQEVCYYDCERQSPDCYTCYTPIVTYDQLHMNWGWGGSYNGWFASNNFSYDSQTGAPMYYNFNSDIREVLNIHP